MFETRSQAWREAGLLRQISPRVVKRARLEALVLMPLFVAVVVFYDNRVSLLGASGRHGRAAKELEPALEAPVTVVTVIALVILGWAIARDVGRSLGPPLFRRLDPATAGTVGFLIRLIALSVSILFALRVAGLKPGTLAVGGAFTAVIIGLAAQQTIGNLIAGMVLLSARPFRVGDRVRFQAGALAGLVEGVVSSLGLLYTTLAQGEDRTMIPNSIVLSAAVVPLREPASVNLRARLRAGVKPSYIQQLLDEAVTVPTRSRPHIGLEEMDADEVVVRIAATPESGSDGTKLADEILAAMSSLATLEHTQPDDSPPQTRDRHGGADRPQGGSKPRHTAPSRWAPRHSGQR
jgi:small conductance mechanosensitive channel